MRKKQLLIFLFLFFLFSGLILPNQTSVLGAVWVPPKQYAVLEGIQSWLDTQLEAGATYIANGMLAGLSSALIAITLPFLHLSQVLFSGVISEGFINISFTGSDNVFVTMGWGIIRGLTNIFIVLGLVVIALATILRIESYQMKKTLPLLLIVALLINLTPMLCGLVIDASNIIMNHFLKGGALLTEDFLSKLGIQITSLWNLKENPVNTLAKGILLVGFNVIGGLIFLLFAFLFLFRYIALWMLVILSPLALFCYIFPATKKMWDQWLNQFIQWCFIGIPAAFTVYLANKMIEELLEGRLVGEVSGMGIIMGYLVPLAFLVGGFLMSLQIGAMGAGLAIKGFKWTETKGLPRLAGEVGAGAIGAIGGFKEGKGIGKIKGAWKGAVTREGRERARETVGKTLEKMHVVRPGFYEETRRKRLGLDETVKRFEKLPTDRLREIKIRTAITTSDVAAKIAAFEVLSKRRDLEETDRKMIPLAMTYGADMKETLKARPDWAEDIGKTIKEQVESRSPRQFREETQAEALKNVNVFLSTDMAKLRDIGVRGTREQKDTLRELLRFGTSSMKEILQKARNAQTQGRTEEFQKIMTNIRAVRQNPNFRL